MKKKMKNDLSEWQKQALDMMKHGCGLSSNPPDMTAKQKREMDDLVKRGLAVVHSSSGIYSIKRQDDN